VISCTCCRAGKLPSNGGRLRFCRNRQMNKHSHYRYQFGLSAALMLLAALVAHLADLVKFDNVALGLIAGVAAGLAFALSDRLGITKITAGPLKLETVELAEEAANAIQRDQRGQFSEVLEANSDLFPVIGARVLWVDDHPELLIAHRQVLRRLGIQVVCATSTEDAKQEVERDPDFALLIQDRVRRGSIEDAKALVKWLREVGKPTHNLLAPLVMYTFDQFDRSVGVMEQDWITQDFSRLLNRVIEELRIWRRRFPGPQRKEPA
jgi:hypothetical protein